MQTYRTDDKKVVKFIHDDGSETCIKTVYSIDYKPNPDTGKVDIFITDRNKYSVFVSASQGCPMNCSFCYLTIDDVPFKKLTYDQIVNNIKQAITEEAKHTDLSSRYIKLCWMGMGEPIITKRLVCYGTLDILEWVMENNLAKGLDGVDISTVLPKINDSWIEDFVLLNNVLEKFPLNPNNKNVVNREFGDLVEYKNRTRFRLFYSLHSAIQENRDVIIPNARKLKDAVIDLMWLSSLGVNVIIHHMFLEGINDSEDELEALVGFMKANFRDNTELRILRYNKHDDSTIRESDAFEKCVCYLQQWLKNIKVQVSYGTDVKSACGQFIYNHTAELEKFKED